jgi:hypothetical protein
LIGKLAAFVLTLCVSLWLATETVPGFALRLNVAARPVVDWLDRREEKPILVVGNSRSYYNDMPEMLRLIADSDGAPERWAITLIAWGGASMQDYWNSPKVQDALGRHWAEVVVQGESRGSASDEQRASFLDNGARLIERARARSPVGLVVNWGWGARLFTDATPAEADARADAYALQLATDHQALVAETGARKIDVNQAFRWLQERKQAPELLVDGNHPTEFGSYVLALALYRDISRQSLRAGLWRPSELSAEAAGLAASAVEMAASGSPQLR